jgi:aspartate-semialdehyde dehydrogenase
MARKESWNVAVVGALGMVGAEMIRTLERRRFPVAELRPLDVAEQAGAEVEYQGRAVRVGEAGREGLRGIDIALFSAGAEASRELAPLAVEEGAVVIDNSSAWRMEAGCPLVVPEVNPQALERHRGIIANPNCSTIQMVVAVKPLHDAARIRRIVVSTYQAASGAGRKAVEELERQSRQYLEHASIRPGEAFPHRIAFNAIPQIDVFQDGGYTKEEIKMARETQKIMNDESIRVSATCVRIPVFTGHAESVNIETERKISPQEVRELLRRAPGVQLVDEPQELRYPMPALAEHTDAVYVGRIREDRTIERGINLWIVADNIRKGAALNAVQIAEILVARGLLS